MKYPFKLLGFKEKNGNFQYFFKAHNRVIKLRWPSKNSLMDLAGMEFWERNYSDADRIEWDRIASDLIHGSYKIGRIPDDKNNP
jgi:hypothetical protein